MKEKFISPDQNKSLDLWQQRQIKVATLEDIKTRIDESYKFAATAEAYQYGRERGADRILVPGRDYAELPGFAGRSPREIIEALPAGSRVLDVGCGYGQLGAEILGTNTGEPLDSEGFVPNRPINPAINTGVAVYGFDAQAQKGQDRLSGMAIGNIDELSSETFNDTRFDLIYSSSVLYHLPDYWGALLRMSNLLQPQGIVLASTVPRVIRSAWDQEPVDDTTGHLLEKDTGEFCFFRDRNIFDTKGRILPSGELVTILNERNPFFKLQYNVASVEYMDGAKLFGGQISGQRTSSEGNLNLKNVFYGLSAGYSRGNLDSLSYIVAKTEKEEEHLNKSGFISLQTRFEPTA